MAFIPASLAVSTVIDRLRWRMQDSANARLTIVTQFFPPDFAATGQFIDDLSRRLAEGGLQTLVLTGQPSYAYSRNRGDRIQFDYNRCIRRTSVSRFWPTRLRGRVVNSILFCLRTQLRLLRQARRGDLLIFTTEPAYLPIVGWLVHLLTGAPYVVLLYDLYPDIAVSLGVLDHAAPLVRFWRWLQTRSLASANELIVLSSTMRERLRDHYPSVKTPVSLIPSWADPERIRPLAKAHNGFAKQHGLESVFTVLYSGNQGRCHDLVTLVDAAALLQEQHSRIQFVIVGSGARHGELVERAQALNLTNLRFLPYQDHATVPEMLATADLAVVSLLAEAEGQVAPSKLYGHLAAATPIAVICGEHSYLRQEVERAGCGAAFRSGEATELAAYIERLSGDPALGERLGQAGRRHLERTASPSVTVKAYARTLARHLPLKLKSYAPPRTIRPAAPASI
ncbi:MAG: glycosyltransferase family 4 protein [Cyanobacteria bacterium]|nr:glycosyltransferase family 4 protein [Cyanobacteriota bacterium]